MILIYKLGKAHVGHLAGFKQPHVMCDATVHPKIIL